MQEIDSHCKKLVEQCRSGVSELPVELLGPANPVLPSGIIAFKHSKYEEINNALHDAGIHAMSNAGRIRVSIHGYNNEDDVNRFLEVLRKVVTTNVG